MSVSVPSCLWSVQLAGWQEPAAQFLLWQSESAVHGRPLGHAGQAPPQPSPPSGARSSQITPELPDELLLLVAALREPDELEVEAVDDAVVEAGPAEEPEELEASEAEAVGVEWPPEEALPDPPVEAEDVDPLVADALALLAPGAAQPPAMQTWSGPQSASAWQANCLPWRGTPAHVQPESTINPIVHPTPLDRSEPNPPGTISLMASSPPSPPRLRPAWAMR